MKKGAKGRNAMKKMLSKICGILILTLCFSMLAPEIKGNAQTASLKSLKANYTYKSFDITGDGKKDSFRIKRTSGYDGCYKTCQLWVNGKMAYQIRGDYFSTSSKLITLSNGKKYLYLYNVYANNDGPICAILKYKGGKFVKVVDFRKLFAKHGIHSYGMVTGVNGNTIQVRAFTMSYTFGSSNYGLQYIYAYGTLKQKTKVARFLGAYLEGKKTRCFTVKKPFNVYSNTSLSTVAFKLKKGDKIMIDQCRITSNYMLLQVKFGKKTGWFKAASKPYSTGMSELFENIYYAG